jgi:hypothetical protein
MEPPAEIHAAPEWVVRVKRAALDAHAMQVKFALATTQVRARSAAIREVRAVILEHATTAAAARALE